jgi:hypothetical protein
MITGITVPANNRLQRTLNKVPRHVGQRVAAELRRYPPETGCSHFGSSLSCRMRVIAKRTLREFWQSTAQHAETQGGMRKRRRRRGGVLKT